MIWLLLAVVVAIAAFPLTLLIRALQTGVWNQRGVDVRRSERPIGFWFGIAMYAVVALAILYLPAYVAWDQLH